MGKGLRSAAMNIASVPCTCGHSCTVRAPSATDSPAGCGFDGSASPSRAPGRAAARAGSAAITKDNLFNSPDGLGFDAAGRLWILTDGNYSNTGAYQGMGNNQMLVANPATKEIRRFLVGPKECEVTGITFTPDHKTMFINIQHPGEGSTPTNLTSTWPDGPGKRPRSSTVVITREDRRRIL